MIRRVDAWHLVAHYGTGGCFRARRPGSRVVWTDARLPRNDGGERGIVIIGRLEPQANGRIRVYEQRVPHDAAFDLLWAEGDTE